MSHDHHHHHTGSIGLAFFLNLLFTVVEITGGLLTNSTAILADAVHDLGDSISLGLSWYLEKFSHRKPDTAYSYGYRRFSLLGALISSVVLVAGSVFLLTETVPRLFNPAATDARGMLLFSLIGITINGIAALRLSGESGINAKVVSLHLLEDVLGWVCVLVVSVVLMFREWYLLDPLLSILITFFVLFNVVKQLKKISVVFLQGIPPGIDVEQIHREIEAVDGVRSCHHTHIWSIDGEHHSLTTHLVVSDDLSKEQIINVKEQTKTLLKKHHIRYFTLEIEYEAEDCGASFTESH